MSDVGVLSQEALEAKLLTPPQRPKLRESSRDAYINRREGGNDLALQQRPKLAKQAGPYFGVR